MWLMLGGEENSPRSPLCERGGNGGENPSPTPLFVKEGEAAKPQGELNKHAYLQQGLNKEEQKEPS